MRNKRKALRDPPSPSLAAALEKVLHEEDLLPPPEKTQQYQRIYDDFMSVLLPILKEDEDLRLPGNCVDLVGSVPFNIRVRHTNEFDVQLVLIDFSHLPKSITINKVDECDGFVHFRKKKVWYHTPRQPEGWNRSQGNSYKSSGQPGWRVAPPHSQGGKTLQKCRDTDGYVMPQKVMNLVYGSVASAISRIEEEYPEWTIEMDGRRQSSPAVTLNIIKEGEEDMAISIDLVPVYRFPWSTLPATFKNRARFQKYSAEVDTKAATWSIVAKNAENGDERSWRLDFYKFEVEAFLDRAQMKNGIRLVKWLRNCKSRSDGTTGHWRHLSSYIIKTEFLWQDDNDNEGGREFWKQNLAHILLEMLRKLANHLEAGRLSDFWCYHYNLLERAGVNPQYWTDMARSLRSVADHLEDSNPPDDAIRQYFNADGL